MTAAGYNWGANSSIVAGQAVAVATDAGAGSYTSPEQLNANGSGTRISARWVSDYGRFVRIKIETLNGSVWGVFDEAIDVVNLSRISNSPNEWGAEILTTHERYRIVVENQHTESGGTLDLDAVIGVPAGGAGGGAASLQDTDYPDLFTDSTGQIFTAVSSTDAVGATTYSYVAIPGGAAYNPTGDPGPVAPDDIDPRSESYVANAAGAGYAQNDRITYYELINTATQAVTELWYNRESNAVIAEPPKADIDRPGATESPPDYFTTREVIHSHALPLSITLIPGGIPALPAVGGSVTFAVTPINNLTTEKAFRVNDLAVVNEVGANGFSNKIASGLVTGATGDDVTIEILSTDQLAGATFAAGAIANTHTEITGMTRLHGAPANAGYALYVLAMSNVTLAASVNTGNPLFNLADLFARGAPQAGAIIKVGDTQQIDGVNRLGEPLSSGGSVEVFSRSDIDNTEIFINTPLALAPVIEVQFREGNANG